MRRPAAWPAWPAWLSRPTGARRATRRLRTQLLAAFALVTVVALAAAGSAVVWLMLDYRAQATTQRLHDAAAGATAAGFMLQRQGVSPEAIASGVAAQVPLPAAHVLVLDESGTVVAEAAASEGTPGAPGAPSAPSATAVPEVFTGRRLDVPSPADAPPSAPSMLWRTSAIEGMVMWLSPLGGAVVWRGTALDGSGYLFVAAGDRPRPAEPLRPPTEAETESPPVQRLPGLLPRYRVVLAIPPHSLPSAWQELAPGLAVAVAVALLAAAGAAWWLAGSIARPIRAVTQAAERIAQGEPHRPIPEEGVEEVTQLARSFNTMGRAVERSQATLRDFVANASHELRTPLTAIQGFSQAVEDGVLPAPAPTRDAAAYIHREAERMRRLIEDLLLLSRVEARDRAATRQAVDLAELLDILAQRLRLVARDRDLHLELELPGQL
ncbi:MAG TPA: histidine kinase dimerization/phospho-acceptor domain-containing protein, partial [Chloroflexota bacterium]|nr:histidine kinase dimerization/phospho-acceptor domain-containing protein [Chloroflexota bacterium]